MISLDGGTWWWCSQGAQQKQAGVAVTQMMIYNTQHDMKHTTQHKYQINNQRRAAC
jgi:hypothetical protein